MGRFQCALYREPQRSPGWADEQTSPGHFPCFVSFPRSRSCPSCDPLLDELPAPRFLTLVSFQENASLHSLKPIQAIQPHSLCSFLLCHPFSKACRSLPYRMEELKSSVSSNLVPELHKLDQKSLEENNNHFFTKRKIAFFIYKTTEMLQN